jgi:hypothetical protein
MQFPNPIVVGGVGGSGTRLVATCLDRMGLFMGHDLNDAHDNLSFTLLFKRPETLRLSKKHFETLIDIFVASMIGNRPLTEQERLLVLDLADHPRERPPQDWRRARAENLLRTTKPLPEGSAWGWKEPNSHVILDRLIGRFPRMKYIHVARNGLDMAYSSNQNQLHFWGSHFLGHSAPINPCNALHYWCSVHRRVITLGKTMADRMLFLNYDEFCRHPESWIPRLADFSGLATSPDIIADLVRLPRIPRSAGRFRREGLAIFDREDVDYVRSLGFTTK